MKLSEHFSLEELISSDTAKAKKIDNTPDYESAARLAVLANKVLEPARMELGSPITISSGYRCAKLNKAVGGVSNSQHLFGEAADLRCKDIPTMRKLFAILTKMDCDQILYEKNSAGAVWIHVSYRAEGNRHDYRDNYLVK